MKLYNNCKHFQEAAREAYAKRDFRQTLELVDELVAAQPDVARWHEMRAAVRVDGKQFESALTDFDQAISATPGKTARKKGPCWSRYWSKCWCESRHVFCPSQKGVHSAITAGASENLWHSAKGRNNVGRAPLSEMRRMLSRQSRNISS